MNDTAADVINEIVSRDSWTTEDHEALMQELSGVGNAPDKCREQLGKLESEHPEPAGAAALKIGMLRYSLCRFDGAIDALKEATNNQYRSYYTGLCCAGLKRFDEAAEHLQKAREKGFEDIAVDVRLIECLILGGDREAAGRELSAARKKLKDTADARYLEGLTAEMDGDVDTAVENYEAALERREHHAESLFRLAYCVDLHGDEEEAVSLYEQCLACRPAHLGVLINLSVLYEDAGEYDKAESCLRKILACNPNSWRAKLFLRDIMSGKDMYYDEDKARRMAKRNAILDISISDFELSVRARNCLKKMNIHTLGDLVRTPEAELLSYKNFGETSLKEIKAMLTAKGLSLGQDLDEEGEVSEFSPAGQGSGAAEDQKDIGVRAIPIENLSLSVRSLRVLENLNIRTLGQLADRTEAELTCQKNFGKTSMHEIKDTLNQYGLGLRNAQ